MASAKGQRMATMYNIGLLGQNQQQGEQNLRETSNQALSSLGQASNSARNALTSYGGQAYEAASRGYNEASSALNQGRDQATSYLNQVAGQYEPYAAAGRRATSALEGSLYGDNSQFKASDNYNFTRDEALRGATRQAAAMGRLDGGGTLAELERIGSGLASAEINNWQNRLQGLSSQGLQAASGIGGALTNLGNLQWQHGQGQSGLAALRGNTLAGINSALGGSIANSFTNQGNAEAGIYSGLGNSLAGLGSQTANAMAGQVSNAANASAAAKNANQNLMLGLGGQILGLGLGGGRTIGGSLLSGLGSMFTGA